MLKMTIFQLGVIVFAICLSTQVVSQNSTETTGGNSTSSSNTTTMAPDTFSGSASTTASPTGAGVSLHAGAFSFLIPVVVAASLQQRYC